MVNEEREKQTEGMDGYYQIHLIYICLFSCMLNECCTTNDGGPYEWMNAGVDCGVSAYSAGNGWMQRVSCHSDAGHNYRELD